MKCAIPTPFLGVLLEGGLPKPRDGSKVLRVKQKLTGWIQRGEDRPESVSLLPAVLFLTSLKQGHQNW